MIIYQNIFCTYHYQFDIRIELNDENSIIPFGCDTSDYIFNGIWIFECISRCIFDQFKHNLFSERNNKTTI